MKKNRYCFPFRLAVGKRTETVFESWWKFYYLCHTVTETDNNYDVYIYFSEKEIKALSSNAFELDNALCIKIDSSTRNDNSYNPSTHSRTILSNSNYSGAVDVNEAEFVYTNAIVNYEITLDTINPDINYNGYSVVDSWYSITILFVLVIFFIYTFIKDIFRIRR